MSDSEIRGADGSSARSRDLNLSGLRAGRNRSHDSGVRIDRESFRLHAAESDAGRTCEVVQHQAVGIVIAVWPEVNSIRSPP